MSQSEISRERWRLLPGERVIWHGRRVGWAPRDRLWTWGPVLLGSLAAVFAAFAALLAVADLPGGSSTGSVAALWGLFAVAVAVAPRFLHDPCEYLLTDRRMIWRRGRYQRSLETRGLSYARIRWHRSAAGVGHLELLRAAPFGPLVRGQRLLLLDVRAPDVVLARMRRAVVAAGAGDNDVPLVHRLDQGERVIWGGHPEGWLVSFRNVGSAVLGLAVILVGLGYGYRAAGILVQLEDQGLPVWSWTWAFFFTAMAVTWSVIMSIGIVLLWHALWRSRALGRKTEYVLTDKRVLIRRGPGPSFSVDRERIVDVARTRGLRGLYHLHLLLDGPGARALADSGAFGAIPPSRDTVAPVLYELRDAERICSLILDSSSGPSGPPPLASGVDVEA